MKTYLMLLISFTAFAQDSLTPGTNPLANILPPPVEKPVYTELTQQAEPVHIELSQNVKDYLYEKDNAQPLEAFKDDKIKFNDYSKPAVTMATPEPENSSIEHDWSKTLWMIFGLFCVFITFITLLFSEN